ncbi:MAG: class I SAM-dependent methyltransferase [Nanoarchaeota archaeon]|nr:class I SAM-dependent methyltransferase [Nanoarchaeota archaeon]
MTASYKDPVKSKARDRLRNYIREHLLSHKSPRNIRVACFPGAEIEGEEALEVKEIYIPLGIPAKNIIGIEYDKDNAQRLRKASLGIKVVEADAYDFFRDSNEFFDIISLDYTGQRTWREKDITRFIAGKNLLEHNGIYSTNHLIKRESQSMKDQLLCGAIFSNATRYIFDKVKKGLSREELELHYKEEREKFIELYKESKDKLNEEGQISLDDIRNQITLGNVAVFGGGILEINPRQHLFRRNKSIEESVQRNITENQGNSKIYSGIEKQVKGYWAYKNAFEDAFHVSQYQLINEGLNEELVKRLLQILSLDAHNAYVSDNIQRYTYTSNKNSNMLLDIFQVKKVPRKAVRLAKELLDLNSEGTITINPNNLGDAKITKIRKQLHEIYLKVKIFSSPEPIYLGSSWQPPKRKEKISKEDAIDLLKSGCSSVEVAESYSGFTKMQLAAFKAHYVTMGKNI